MQNFFSEKPFSAADAAFASYIKGAENSGKQMKTILFLVLSLAFSALFAFTLFHLPFLTSVFLFSLASLFLLFSSLFWQKKLWGLLVFLVFFLFSFSVSTTNEKLAFIFLGTGFFLVGTAVFSSTSNQLELKIFSTASSALKSASFVFAFAMALFFTSQKNVEDFVSTSLLSSPQFEQILEKMLSSEQGDATKLFLKSYEKDIDVLCEGNASCIADTTNKMKTTLSSQFSGEKTETEKETVKAMVRQQIQQKMQNFFRGDFIPEDMKAISPFPLEKMLPIFLFLLLFSPLFSFFFTALAAIFTVIFYLLFLFGVIQKRHVAVQKETVY